MPIPNVERRERRYNLRLRQSRQVERRLLPDSARFYQGLAGDVPDGLKTPGTKEPLQLKPPATKGPQPSSSTAPTGPSQ